MTTHEIEQLLRKSIDHINERQVMDWFSKKDVSASILWIEEIRNVVWKEPSKKKKWISFFRKKKRKKE